MEESKTNRKSDGENFANVIVKIMIKDKLNIIEAITSFSESTGVDVNDIVPLLDKHTIEKIRLEAVSLNYIREEKPRSLFDNLG